MEACKPECLTLEDILIQQDDGLGLIVNDLMGL